MESSNFKFELVKHFINRKVIQELLQFKNIQTIQKTPLIMSDIVEKVKEKEEKLIYEIMKKELLESFSDFRYLARGNQGYVILAKEKQTNKRFAIKGCYVRNEQGIVEEEEDFNEAKKEIEILSQCSGSPYVSNLIKPIDLKKNQFLYLVFTEYQGTLQEVIDGTQYKRLNEISAIKYSKDIAEGLLYIHNKGYLVNDLKMDNILIDYNGNAVVSNFGYAQKVKIDSVYVFSEYQMNLYFQAPECVDREVVKLYEDEYKKLGVETQMNPSQRSEACSFGYLIYTMVQGKKEAFNFIIQKHKPLVYDDDFKSFKYSTQLQYIIDGLTKFIPRERLSISEAFEQLKAIISTEFNIDQKFQIQVSEQAQKLSQNQLSGIEFVEQFDKQYYPIVQNEDRFIKELVSEEYFSKQFEKLNLLQIENESLQQDQEKLKKTLKERENQIQQIQDSSQINIQKKEHEITEGKVQNNTKVYENFKNHLINLENIYQNLIQEFESLIYQKDQYILSIEKELQTKTAEIEELKKNKLNLEAQNKSFIHKTIESIIGLPKKIKNSSQITNQFFQLQIKDNQDISQYKIQELKEQIKENLDKAQQKIQELKEQTIENQDKAQQHIQELNQQIRQNQDREQKTVQELQQKIKSIIQQQDKTKQDSDQNSEQIIYYDETQTAKDQSFNVTQINIDLENSEICDSDFQNITTTLEKFQHFEKIILNLKSNNISNEGAINIAYALERIRNLTHLNLDLSYNNIDHQGVERITNSLQKFHNISQLSISLAKNKLGDEGAQTVGKFLGKNKKLMQLSIDLTDNRISYKGVEIIANSLQALQQATYVSLNFDFNDIYDQGVQFISIALEKCQNMKELHLYLAKCQIGFLGLQSIANTLMVCQNIQQLYLGLNKNMISYEGVDDIAKSLIKCQNITLLSLDLSENDILSTGSKIIAATLEKCQYITQLKLDLSLNKIDDQGVQVLAKAFINCKNIIKLSVDLSKNMITQEGSQILKDAQNISNKDIQFQINLSDQLLNNLYQD